METILTLGDLERWVRNLGIENLVERKYAKALNPDGTPKDKTGKREYIQALQKHFLSVGYPSGVPHHLELALSSYPQMAARQNQLKPERLEEILESPDWVCEEKIQGFRARFVFVQGEGCFWYSRYLSDANMLPRLIPLPSPEVISPEIMSFVLDGEIIAKDPQGLVRDLRESKIILENEQEATTYVLSNFNPRDIVPEAVFVFKAIDILELNSAPLVDRELGDRKYLLSLLMRSLRGASGVEVQELPFSILPTGAEKFEYFQRIIDLGGEGMIVKDIHSEYEIDARPLSWIKFKREDEVEEGEPDVEAPTSTSMSIGDLFSGLDRR